MEVDKSASSELERLAHRGLILRIAMRDFIFLSVLTFFPLFMYFAIPLTVGNRSYQTLSDSGDLYLFAFFLLAIGVRDSFDVSLDNSRNQLRRTILVSISLMLLLLSATMWMTRLAVGGAPHTAVYGPLGWTTFGLSICLFGAATWLRATAVVGEWSAATEAHDQRLQSSFESTLRTTLALDDGPGFDGVAGVEIAGRAVDNDRFIFTMYPGERKPMRVTIVGSEARHSFKGSRLLHFTGRSTTAPLEFRVTPESDGLRFDPDIAILNVAADEAREAEFVMTAATDVGSYSVLVSVTQSNRMGMTLRTTCDIGPLS